MPQSKSKIKNQKSKIQVKGQKSEKIEAKVTAPKVVKLAKQATTRSSGLSIPVYSLAGRAAGTMRLPKEVFGQEVNQKLLAQAIRVYLGNQKQFSASTKTRGEVRGSTAKIWRQKGTGRARHGARGAPIFVGGGVVFGPKPRKVILDLPKKMRRKALVHALSAKLKDKEIIGLGGLEKATGKTKQIAQLFTQLNSKFKVQSSKFESALIITADKIDNVVRGVRNIPGVSILPTTQLNAYEVLKHQILLISKDAIDKLTKPSKEVK